MGKAIFFGHKKQRKLNNEWNLYLVPHSSECFVFHVGNYWRNPILSVETTLGVQLEEENLYTEFKVSEISAERVSFPFSGARNRLLGARFILSDEDSINTVMKIVLMLIPSSKH